MKVKYSLVIINDRQVDQLTLILRFKTKEGVIFFKQITFMILRAISVS